MINTMSIPVAILAMLACSCAVQLPDPIPATVSRESVEGGNWPESHYDDMSSIVQVLSRPTGEYKEADTPMRRLAVEAAAQCEQKLYRIRRDMKNARNTRDALSITAGVIGALGGFSATILASVQALRAEGERESGLDIGAAVSGGVAVVGAIIGIVSPIVAEPENLRPEHARAKRWYTKAKMEAVALSAMQGDDAAYDAQLLQVISSLYGCEEEPDQKTSEIVRDALAAPTGSLGRKKQLEEAKTPGAVVEPRADESKRNEPKEAAKKEEPKKEEPKK